MYSWKREDRQAWELENRIPEKAAISQPYFSFNCMSHSDPLRSCGVLGSNSEERTTPEQCVQVSLRDRYTITSIELMASSENATKTHVKSSFSHCTIAKGGKIISSCSLSLLPWTSTAQGSFTRYIPAVCFTKQTVISGKTQLVSGEWWWGVLWREQWKQAPLSSLIARCHTILPTLSSDNALELTPTSSLPAARGCPETSAARSGRTCFPKLSTIQPGFQGHPEEPGSWGTAVPPPPPAVALLPINIPRLLFPTPLLKYLLSVKKRSGASAELLHWQLPRCSTVLQQLNSDTKYWPFLCSPVPGSNCVITFLLLSIELSCAVE